MEIAGFDSSTRQNPLLNNLNENGREPDTMTPGTRTHDHEFIEAVDELYQHAEHRDAAEGGVHSSIVADHLGISQSNAKERLRELAQDDRLAEYDGLDPESRRWRKSYGPIDAEESHAGEGGWTTPS